MNGQFCELNNNGKETLLGKGSGVSSATADWRCGSC